MPKFYPSIPDDLQPWLLEQPVFWVATAPKHGKHINVSPKGTYSSLLHIHTPNRVSYVDVTGSGAETVAHLYDNGRITMMFNSFSASPRIMRLFGTGRVTEREQVGFEELLAEIIAGQKSSSVSGLEKDGRSGDAKRSTALEEVRIGGFSLDELRPAIRSIITIDLFTCQTSCGFGVPTLRDSHPLAPSSNTEFAKADQTPGFNDRPTILKWGINKANSTNPVESKATDPSPLEQYWIEYNAKSLDKLPGTRKARALTGEILVLGDLVAWVKRRREGLVGMVVGALIMFMVLVALDS